MPLTSHPRSRSVTFAIRALAASAAVVLLASCGGGSDASSDAESTLTVPESEWVDETGKGSITILTRDNTFTPQYVKVSPGTKIVFDNKGRTAHNVIPSVDDQFEAIAVDDLQPGDQATLVLEGAGEYPYYCSLHGTKTKGMIGAITVVD